MSEKRIIQIDAKTGEQLENGYLAYLAPKRQNGFGKRWVAMSQDAGAMLLAKSDLSANDFRILFGLIAMLDFENLIVVNQAELGRRAGMHRQHVSRSIKRLIDLGALLEGPRIGVNRSYRLNPNFGWKGSARNHLISLDAERRRRSAIEPEQPERA